MINNCPKSQVPRARDYTTYYYVVRSTRLSTPQALSCIYSTVRESSCVKEIVYTLFLRLILHTASPSAHKDSQLTRSSTDSFLAYRNPMPPDMRVPELRVATRELQLACWACPLRARHVAHALAMRRSTLRAESVRARSIANRAAGFLSQPHDLRPLRCPHMQRWAGVQHCIV